MGDVLFVVCTRACPALLKTFEGEAYESVTPSVGIFPAKTFDPDA